MAITHEYQRNGLIFRTKAEKVPTVDQKIDKDWYEWRIELAGSPEQLDEIGLVEYILDPSFPKRVRVEEDPKRNFALDEEGWGEFNIIAKVHFKNGDKKSAIVPLKLFA